MLPIKKRAGFNLKHLMSFNFETSPPITPKNYKVDVSGILFTTARKPKGKLFKKETPINDNDNDNDKRQFVRIGGVYFAKFKCTVLENSKVPEKRLPENVESYIQLKLKENLLACFKFDPFTEQILDNLCNDSTGYLFFIKNNEYEFKYRFKVPLVKSNEESYLVFTYNDEKIFTLLLEVTYPKKNKEEKFVRRPLVFYKKKVTRGNNENKLGIFDDIKGCYSNNDVIKNGAYYVVTLDIHLPNYQNYDVYRSCKEYIQNNLPEIQFRTFLSIELCKRIFGGLYLLLKSTNKGLLKRVCGILTNVMNSNGNLCYRRGVERVDGDVVKGNRKRKRDDFEEYSLKLISNEQFDDILTKKKRKTVNLNLVKRGTASLVRQHQPQLSVKKKKKRKKRRRKIVNKKNKSFIEFLYK